MNWIDAVDRYSRLVASIARRHGLRDQDVDEVLQLTWKTAIEKSPEPPDDDGLVRWLAAIAVRHSQGQMRRNARAPATLDEAGGVTDGAELGVLELVARLELEQAVREALDGLSERDRVLVRDVVMAETPLSYAEAARLLGVAPGSVGALRMRALERLRRRLEKRGFSC